MRRLALLSLLGLIPILSSASAQVAICAERGNRTLSWTTEPIVCCKKFHTQGARPAIRLPDDSETIVYGVLDDRLATAVVVRTRGGKQFPVKANVVPANADRADFSQMIFKAYLGTAKMVYRIEPAVFVEKEAVVRRFAGAFWSGELTNM